MRTVYAFTWTLTGTQEEFEERVPALLEWLTSLRRAGKLCACGSWADSTGGLTVLVANSEDEARRLHEGNPLNLIGTTALHEWEVFFANLVEST
jgi:uncharacterized protein YciI